MFRHFPAEFIGWLKLTQGSETSQYLQEKKSNETPLVAASERGSAQTGHSLIPQELNLYAQRSVACKFKPLRPNAEVVEFVETFVVLMSVRGCRTSMWDS